MKKYFSVQRARRIPAVPVLAAVGGGLRQPPKLPLPSPSKKTILKTPSY